MKQIRADLLTIFNAALHAVGGASAVKQELISGDYPDQFHLIAIGKAADAMLQGVIEVETTTNKRILSALLISKHGHISPQTKNDPRILHLESDHPLPKQASLNAGAALTDYLSHLAKNEACLFLISGGASSLVEVLQDAWDLPQLQALTDYLLSNAYPIDQINIIRRRISSIKGGGLWQYINDRDGEREGEGEDKEDKEDRPTHCLMISDVPSDNPADIGSGLLFPVNDIELPDLPEQFTALIPVFQQHKQANNFTWKIIASLSIAKQAAAKKALELGYQANIQAEFLAGEATEVAKTCVRTSQENKNTLLIWGGETLVYLPENPGAGGRNQHLALSAAIAMQATNINNTVLLAAGTDGSDGVSDATGAIVDKETVNRGSAKRLNAEDHLRAGDSNSYLNATQDTLLTGATGTNVMDLVLAISTAP